MVKREAWNRADNRTIRQATGHTNGSILDENIADAELWTDPASGYLGL